MNFNEYQEAARKTAIYPNKGTNLIYPVLGLNGEAGEIAEKLKKVIRDENNNTADPKFRIGLIEEVGDALWYIAALCSEIGVTMDHVAEINVAKLQDRAVRDRLHGEGDNR